jgi:hypothetical protein
MSDILTQWLPTIIEIVVIVAVVGMLKGLTGKSK